MAGFFSLFVYFFYLNNFSDDPPIMSGINESESVDLSRAVNTRMSTVNKCMKNVFNANKILSISEKNLCRSTGYLECKDFNLKVNNLIRFYESMSSKSKDPLKNAIVPIKRKSTVLEGNSVLETNKFSELENGKIQIPKTVSKKIKKNNEEIDYLENEYSDEDSSSYDYNFDYRNRTYPDVFYGISDEQLNLNFSLPDNNCLNHSYAEHIAHENDLFYKNHLQTDFKTPVSSKPTHWEIDNKKKIEEDDPFADREKLFVMHDEKGRINGYQVKLILSTSEEDEEANMTEDELKALDALSRHSNIENKPVNFENSEEINKINYTNFKYPSLDLAEDLLRCEKCDFTPHYYQVVRRLFDCARLGDFGSLAEKHKFLKEARAKRKAEELEKAKKRVKRAASRPTPRPKPAPSPVPSRNYSVKRKATNKAKKNVKRKNLTKKIQIKPSVEAIIPLEEITKKVNENDFVTDNIEKMDNECNLEVKRDVELKKINTNLFDDKRDELISRGLLPAWLGTNPLHEDSEVGKFVKTELTSLGLLPGEKDCGSLEKVKDDKVKKYKCDKCDATFTSSNGKKYHINKVHTTEKDSIDKPYKCLEEGCFKKFTSKNGLKSHKKIKHPAKNTL